MFDKAIFDSLIKEINIYYAHTPEGKAIKSESLRDHSALVIDYAEALVSAHNLDRTIDNLIKHSILECIRDKEKAFALIKDLFWSSIAFHDIGKINECFQKDKMKNDIGYSIVNHQYGSQHSIISVYLFLAYFYSKIDEFEDDNDWEFMCNIALYMSYPIYKHHASDLYRCQDNNNWSEQAFERLQPYLDRVNIKNLNIEIFHDWLRNKATEEYLFEQYRQMICLSKKDAFPLYAIVKLCYSLLTASDYLATSHYKNQWSDMSSDFNVIDDTLRKKIIEGVRTIKSYNKDVYQHIASIIPDPDAYKEQSNDNLNKLRKFLSCEVITNVRANLDKNLFYIEAPTGGGKTNLSMLAMAELLEANTEINKVFYVFPFTTLITQTHSSLKDTIGLSDNDVAEIHSKAPIVTRINNGSEDSEYLNYLDGMFMNYPISLLSHVSFFDILKTNKKEKNYLLHRLANSIVIIDEIQSYSPGIWDEVLYFIRNYSPAFNIKFIIMSATLPKIGELLFKSANKEEFVYLVNDKNKYFQNPNFCNRVEFDYSLLEWGKPKKENQTDYLDKLADVVIEQSKNYAYTNNQYPNSVYTIIEFIFKRTASEFYSIIKSKLDFFDDIYVLSGTILEPRRKEIIRKLKSKEQRTKKTLLITTQVVEAGVDIDMDLGFKDRSLVDSDEQLAGRINRNVNKPSCRLFIFDCCSEKILYGNDNRYKFLIGKDEEYKEILETKDFDILYSQIIKDVNTRNNSKHIQNIDDLRKQISCLDFAEVDKYLRIIDQENISVFVPIDIPVKLLSDILYIVDSLDIPYGYILSGTDVWNCYQETITNTERNFMETNMRIKQIKSLMSQFVFNLFPKGKDFETLSTYGKEECGFFYLENNYDIYSLEEGINDSKFEDDKFL